MAARSHASSPAAPSNSTAAVGKSTTTSGSSATTPRWWCSTPPMTRTRSSRRSAAGNVVAVVCTHGHNDHVTVAAATRQGARRSGAAASRRRRAVANDAPRQATSARSTTARRCSVGGTELRALHTPGHSPGSVCWYAPDLGAVFSGDTLFQGGPGATGRSYSDFPTILESISEPAGQAARRHRRLHRPRRHHHRSATRSCTTTSGSAEAVSQSFRERACLCTTYRALWCNCARSPGTSERLKRYSGGAGSSILGTRLSAGLVVTWTLSVGQNGSFRRRSGLDANRRHTRSRATARHHARPVQQVGGRGEAYQGTVDKCVIEEELDNGSVHYTSCDSLLIQLLLERDASGDLEQARHVLTRFEEIVEPVPRPRQESRRPGSPDRRRAARR